jgi:hypothetical protein
MMGEITPIAYCHRLELQRQNFDVRTDYRGHKNLCKFYRYTYDPEFAAQNKKLPSWLKQVHGKLGAFVWVLIALAGSLRYVHSFEPYTDAIEDWAKQPPYRS